VSWPAKPFQKLFFRTPEQGARYSPCLEALLCTCPHISCPHRTSIYCALSSQVESVSGKYFSDEQETDPQLFALDYDAAAALWAYSEQLVDGF
jgi:hypothetical protein